MKRTKIHSLTGLRAFAALWVVIHNAASYAPMDPGTVHAINWGIFTPIIAHGWIGVDLFFILSGFVISYVYQQHFSNTLTIKNTLNYYGLRLGRIYPLHLACLAIAFCLILLAIPPFNKLNILDDLIYNLTLTTSWGFSEYADWNGPAWSLSAEWFVYLLFPFLARFLIPTQSIWAMVLVPIASAIIIYTLWSEQINLEIDDGLGALIRVTIGFTTGCVVYNIYTYLQEYKWDWDRICLLSWLSFFSCCYIPENTHIANFIFPLLSSIIILSLAFSKRYIAGFFAHPVFVYLGNISFAIYMAHQPVFVILRTLFSNHNSSFSQPMLFLHLFLALVILIAVAAMLYHTVEQPCRKWAKTRYKMGYPMQST